MAIDLTGKDYSPGQIAQSVWDEDSNRIRVDAEVTAVIGELSVDLDSADDSITIGNPNNSNTLNVNADGSINVKSNETTTISYAEVLGITNNLLTTVISETQFTTKKLNKIEFSGTNLAEFTLVVNGNIKLKYRTNVTNLNGQIQIEDLPLTIGDVVQIKTITPKTGGTDFNASLFYKT